MSLAVRLEEQARRRPESVALRTDDGDLSYGDLDRMAGGVASGLAAAGVGPGDRVALMGGSHPEFVAAVYGVWKLGGVLVALNAQLGPEEVLYQLRNSSAAVVLADEGRSRDVIDAVMPEASDLRAVFGMRELPGAPRPAVEVPDGADASIFYTSGTTGVPKGATHTHGALGVEVDMVARHYSVTEHDELLSILPIYLLSILVLGPMLAVHSGAPCRLMSRYDPAAFARHVRNDRTTVVGATVPLLFVDLLGLPEEQAREVDLSSIRVAGCGGSPMPPEIRREFESRYGFRFVHAYGGTEGPAMVSCDPFDRERKFDSVGMPLPHVRITVEDDQDREVPPGTLGEICTSAHRSGPYAGLYEPIRCYWGMPEATAEALRGGRFHWGDVGYLDEDGFLYLVDRKKDMIIRGGMNVYPKELETVLHADPRIAECAIVGASHPRYGEVPVAFVRRAPGADVDEEAVMALVNERLAPFKHLAGVRFIDSFPRNALGKILKRELRATLAAASASEPAASAGRRPQER